MKKTKIISLLLMLLFTTAFYVLPNEKDNLNTSDTSAIEYSNTAIDIPWDGKNAFPGAEGFGSKTKGAYSGSTNPTILYVNSLNELSEQTSSNSGSLRWCLEQTYPRIILVKKSGTIILTSHIQVRDPYISFFGQTGKLLVKGEGIDIRTHDVILQHIIVRPGDDNTTTAAGGIDGIEIRRGAYNVIIDHCSVAWAIDENVSLWADTPIKKVTISNCIIGEGLNNSIHPEGAHSKGLLIGTDCDSVSVIKNYFINNADRNPLMQGKTNTEVINNLIYNGGNQIMLNDYATFPLQTSIINNVYLRGVNETSSESVKILNINNLSKVYLSGNTSSVNDWELIDDRYLKESYIRVNVAPINSGVIPINKELVKNYVLENVGAWYWDRDVVDKRLINDFGTSATWKDVPPDDITYPEINLNYILPDNPHLKINGVTNLEKYIFESSTSSINIVFDGDSQTSSDIWPAKIIELLRSEGYTDIRSANYAVSGQTTSQMVNDVTSQIVPRYNSNYNENLVLYYIGYNDTWAGSSVDAVTLHNRLVTYYNTLKSAGFKVLMINLPDGTNRTGISVINNMYAGQNNDISDIFVNCRETGGVFEDYTNTVYYRDNVHLSTTGCNYLAEHYVYPKLLELLGYTNQPIKITNIVISGAGGANTITTKSGTLQLSASILPNNATNKTVVWSIQNGTGQASISINGLVTATTDGAVTARATSTDGSNVYGTFIIIISNQVVTSNILTGLQSYYKFDETSGNVKDETGSNPGTISTGITRTIGKINGAYYFDSNSDYINLSKLITLKNATYSFWIKILSISTDLLIMGNDQYYSRIFIGSNNNLKLETNTNGQEYAFYNSFSTGLWYHIALVRDNNTVTFYRNGINIGSSTISNSNSLTLSQIGFNGRSFRGTIDEVGIWNRPLTPTEVSVVFNSSYPFSSIPINIPVSSVSVLPSTVSLTISSTITLAATIYPENATNKNISWNSNNTSIATVSSLGIVTGQSAGNAIITVTTQDGSKTSSCMITVLPNNNSSSLMTGIIAYYKLDEVSGNAKDEVSSNYGIASSNITRVSGKINGAYYFDSNTDYISLASIITQKTGTYSFWIKILSIYDDLLIMGNNPYYSRIFIGVNNNLKIETNTNGQEFAFYNSFSTGLWYHITLVRDNDNIKFYRNGTNIGSSTISNSNSLTLSQIGFNGKSFRGTIDEVGIWNRPLTPAEVLLLNNGASFPFSTLKSTNLNESISNEVEKEILFYPNPAKDKVYLSCISDIQIFDLKGKIIINAINQNSIDIFNLSNGIYIIKIKNDNNFYNYKLVKY